MSARFPYLDEIELPKDVDVETYKRMYLYYRLPASVLFGKDAPKELIEWERSMFWYHDALHHYDVMYPFDDIHPTHWEVVLSAYNSRIFVVPPANGIPHRIVNGKLFISFVPVTDPKEVEKRLQYFQRRAGHYYQNWNEIYEKYWKPEAERIVKEMESLEFKDLPELEDESVVFEHKGISPSIYSLVENWLRLIMLHQRLWWKHFEMLNLGYAAYLLFYQFMKQKFPDIPDQHIALMVAGIDVILFKPDLELRRLAKLAVELGVADRILSFTSAEQMEAELSRSSNEKERRWFQEWNNAKYPWFYYTTGIGFYHHEPRWIDDLNVPFNFLKDYIVKVKRGETLETATERLRAQRDEIARKYEELLPPEDRKTFREYLQIARTVFPYVEEHNFYVEHWGHTVFYQKVKEVARILVKHGFLEREDDIFYMNWMEVYQALMDLVASWAVVMPTVGKYYWPREIAKRKEILAKLKQAITPPASGRPPEVVTEPFTVMLWGVTRERIDDWLGTAAAAGKIIKGFPASPGVVEGKAVVVRSVEELSKVKEGDILVCPNTSPAWGPVFAKVKAVVSDIGGLMAHAAIVAREYGVPAVVGTGNASRLIKDGQRIRVDGYKGVVEILE
ncbi:Phosphoenolpyruvate synthase/pyruvate phosphate dikinase [Pyrobaculum oguniense TE7]|uniref:Phosphoenolpyruvate synthase/pyruvate phosphate dikinase n=1 Tax=Pyrobaculum oguniense (strain DSM 13380 / JCM 10595 / TE7) TaxID=698757 RepID=H6Q9F3_PYROT|nr:Phosphoenolpyruvate synthase/pyruvate phosphate dikinase [Pyrobaculum oguniense TE7]